MLGLEILQSAIDYMEDHILEDITYEDVAKYVHMSPYEFHRTFSFISGLTVNAYLRNRRMSLAGEDLLHSDALVIDLAMKYCFDSAEGFSKAFTRFHGIAPKYAKNPGVKLTMYPPFSIHVSLEGGKKLEYRIQNVKAGKFIALVKSFPVEIINEEGNDDISAFWGQCYKRGLIEPLKSLRTSDDDRLFGLCAPLTDNQTFFDYGIGIYAKDDSINHLLNSLPENLRANYQIWDLQECTYLIFDCIGNDGDCITKTWQNFYQNFLPQSSYKSSENTDFEIYFDKPRKDFFCELWIPVEL